MHYLQHKCQRHHKWSLHFDLPLVALECLLPFHPFQDIHLPCNQHNIVFHKLELLLRLDDILELS